MLYELHLTTTPDADVGRWSALCHGLGIKPLVIELAAGTHPRQVMMAATHEGDDPSAAGWRDGLWSAFEAAGFSIVRVKLEAPLDKASGRDSEYHEAHVKMLLTDDEARLLPEVAADAEMHISRNILAPNAFGRGKWYMTARSYGGTRYDAAERFAQAYAVVAARLLGVRMEMETVLADSNPGLDEGWAA